MNAEMYGLAESLIGFSAILGGIVAGLLTVKLKMNKLSFVIVIIGLCFVLSGAIFLFQVGKVAKYVVNLIGFCGFQAAICVFSIFTLSYIQKKTPNNLIGKVMSYVATISMCSQPLSQMVYGILFDKMNNGVYLILIPTGIMILMIGLLSIHFFEELSSQEHQEMKIE